MATEFKQSLQTQFLDQQAVTPGQRLVLAGEIGLERATQGMNSVGALRQVDGCVVPTSGSAANSYYAMARVPTNAVMKSVEWMYAQLTAVALTTFTADITIAHSDCGANPTYGAAGSQFNTDATPAQLQVVPSGLTGAPANAFIANPFNTSTGLSGTAAIFAKAATPTTSWTDITFNNVAVVGGATVQSLGMSIFSTMPLWQVAGFTADPGGFFDIVLLTTAPSSFTGIMQLQLRARYCIPAG
jgi:hypothetical protein